MARLLRWLGFGGAMVDWKIAIIDPIENQVDELQAALEVFPADVLLSDPLMFAAAIVAEDFEIPWAVLGITPLMHKIRDLPPLLLGMNPRYSILGRLWTAFLYWFTHHVVFGEPLQYFKLKTRQNGWGFKSFPSIASPYLHLQASVPAFEYPRSDLPPQVHYIGPIIPEPEPGFKPHAWWHELAEADRPIVLVTQGTVATNADKLLIPALGALGDEDVLIVATTVSKSPQELGLVLLPNARVEQSIPFANLMPYVSIYITNGGFGGVSLALANGVPVIVAGITEEKPEVANRVEHAGAGINLRTAAPTCEQIRSAVHSILSDQRFRKSAQKIQAEAARHEPPTEAANLVEQLAITKRPVLVTQFQPTEFTRGDQLRVKAYV